MLEAVYQVELTLQDYREQYLTGKVAVKVPHPPESFASYFYRKIMVFLSAHFQY
ncbi:hypothetical protein ACLKMH_01090 [Psychromonas sp. KJ10-10]|uniref:hypothetical protein n=1 Tax=Psychromonas sp. KJ10-10 TaxID=3391823 RepID=UPI0039B39FE6